MRCRPLAPPVRVVARPRSSGGELPDRVREELLSGGCRALRQFTVKTKAELARALRATSVLEFVPPLAGAKSYAGTMVMDAVYEILHAILEGKPLGRPMPEAKRILPDSVKLKHIDYVLHHVPGRRGPDYNERYEPLARDLVYWLLVRSRIGGVPAIRAICRGASVDTALAGWPGGPEVFLRDFRAFLKGP